MWRIVGLIAAIILPFWNVPFIYRVIKRKSASDVSLYWLFGVWICVIAMLPSALSSTDIIWKTFNIVNLILFSGVVVAVMKYRWKK